MRGEFFIFVYISLDGAVIPFISFHRVPVFSEEGVNGPFLCSLSLFSLTGEFGNAGASETQ